MELMDQDLDQMIKNDIPNFTENHLIRIVYNTLCAIAFIHETNVMHRDFKPANLLVDSSCNVKITDFGLSRSVSDTCIDANGFNSMAIR